MTSTWQKWLFEILYSNRYLYRFASTVPFAGYWRTWQRLVLPHLHGHSVLELGCGLGDLLADMMESGYDCRAIEQSQEMVAAARETLQQRQCGEPAWVIQGQTHYLPFADASFDTVVSTFPNEYIYNPHTISEVKRVLRPGGRAVILISANLLPVDSLQSFLLLIQMFVYGTTVFNQFLKSNVWNGFAPSSEAVTTEVVSNSKLGKQIPLEQYQFRRQDVRVRSRNWEAYFVIAEI